MNIQEEIANIARQINVHVSDLLDQEIKRSKNTSPIIHELLNNIKIISASGKRLRGALFYHSYVMHGGENKEEALRAAAFIELIHSYLLIDDDIMDKSDIRRGIPTIHKIYRDMHEAEFEKKDAYHFGECVAINAAVALCHFSLQILIESDFPADLKIRAFKKINEQIMDTAYGQTLDVFGEVLDNIDEEYVMQVQTLKTSRYTYETPLHVGAILAGATEDDLKDLTKYSLPSGIAFQIKDDILGMFGDEKIIGKPADSDLKEGKQTLLILRTLKCTKNGEKTALVKALGNPNIIPETLEKVREVIKDCGALEYSESLALDLIDEAKSIVLANKKWSKEGKEFLMGLADYVISRTY